MRLIRSGWEPFEVMMLAGLAMSGGGGLLLFDKLAPTSTIHSFPPPWGQALLGFLAVASLIALMGAARPTLDGVRTERAGLVGIVVCGAVYGVWALGANGATAYPFAVLLFYLAGGALWRVLRIRRDLRAGV